MNEAVRITSSKADFLLNSKSEFHQSPIVHVVPVNGLREDQGVVEQGGGVQEGGRRVVRGTTRREGE